MTPFVRFIALVFSILFLIIFVLLVRRRSFKPFYSFIWLLVSIFLISVVVFESFYKSISDYLGLTDASFLVIIGIIGFLVIYILHISLKLTIMSDRIQELISYTGILENEIRKLKEKVKN